MDSQALGDANGVRILGYHGINDRSDSWYAVSTADFEMQMKYLSENYTMVAPDALSTALQGREQFPSGAVSVTVDDGYDDFYTNAFPILSDLGIPATVFLPVGLIGSNALQNSIHDLPQQGFLSWREVREMSRYGIEFGSHSVSHRSLTKLSRQAVAFELEHSKAELEQRLGKPVRGLAYPYGTYRHTSTMIECQAAEAGYKWAVTSIGGVNNVGSNRFALRRTIVDSDIGVTGFKRALWGSLDAWVAVQKLGRYL